MEREVRGKNRGETERGEETEWVREILSRGESESLRIKKRKKEFSSPDPSSLFVCCLAPLLLAVQSVRQHLERSSFILHLGLN